MATAVHARERSIGELYQSSLDDPRRARLFASSVGFMGAFGVARGMAYAAKYGIPPFHFVYKKGVHIHHLVYGICLLLLIGYLWLLQVGLGERRQSRLWSELTSFLFGVGSALTLDEFAMWLRFSENAYFTNEDRESLDAVVVFGALLSSGLWGAPFWQVLARKFLPFAGKGSR
ncbi:MAG TPA: hypothetical protein VKU60_17630 [Chloroflexota bacterium]|nr:hypothetical protein [Chloroflexota bacterium]